MTWKLTLRNLKNEIPCSTKAIINALRTGYPFVQSSYFFLWSSFQSKFPKVQSAHHMIVGGLIYFTVKNFRFEMFLIWHNGTSQYARKIQYFQISRNQETWLISSFFLSHYSKVCDCLLFFSIIVIVSVEWEDPYNKRFLKFSNTWSLILSLSYIGEKCFILKHAYLIKIFTYVQKAQLCITMYKPTFLIRKVILKSNTGIQRSVDLIR